MTNHMLDEPIEIRPNQEVLELWWAGVAAVNGRALVRQSLKREKLPETGFHVAAVGKAAASMLEGVRDFSPFAARELLITKEGHVPGDLLRGEGTEIHESAHPVPDARSLEAGKALRQFVETVPDGEHLLLLISGGASALAEELCEGYTADQLAAFSRYALSAGTEIRQINRDRALFSRIKGGKLLAAASRINVHVRKISDVKCGDEALIGSGIGSLERLPANSGGLVREALVVGNNAQARDAVAAMALKRELSVVENSETLYGDVFEVAERLAHRLKSGPDGVYIWGGEPTVELPSDPGRGGRNQSLALALGIALAGETSIHAMVAGTDGTDGPTEAAGGLVPVLGPDQLESARAALARADAGPFLENVGALFTSGPTGTNVMDLAIAVKRSETKQKVMI
ncbi:DUF4147 domain-containing protein [Nitratireductor sp. GISD-1A_MAKvit]|uniref:DUF4147 domain-containing protein n=1 Tax=Nitratireductor sp. GISD-1A_MAKvit TaxID=3234198 RepID=UPI0034652757